MSRWFDGALEARQALGQPNPVRAMVFWGHAPNSQFRGPDLKKGLEKVDLLVIVDPVVTLSSFSAIGRTAFTCSRPAPPRIPSARFSGAKR